MTRKVRLFDTVVREFQLELEDDFDLEAEDAVIDIIDRVQKLKPVDESGTGISIWVDDEEFY